MTVEREIRAVVRGALPRRLRWAEPWATLLLGIDAALEVVGDAEGSALTFITRVLESLDVGVVIEGAIPPQDGALIVVANHPLGGIDGLILSNMLLSVRSDVKVLARAGLALLPAIREHVIPIPPKRSSAGGGEAVIAAVEHLRTGGALLVFPAGQVAGASLRGHPVDARWHSGAGRLVIATGAATMPMAVLARNSVFFYVLRAMSERLSALLLVREALRMRGREVRIRGGTPMPASSFSGRSPEEVVMGLRIVVEALQRGRDRRGEPDAAGKRRGGVGQRD